MRHESTLRYEFNQARINALFAMDNAKFADEEAWVPDREHPLRAAERLRVAAGEMTEAARLALVLADHYEAKAREFEAAEEH